VARGEAEEGLPVTPIATPDRVGSCGDIVRQHRPDHGACPSGFTHIHAKIVAHIVFEQDPLPNATRWQHHADGPSALRTG
jgi:hypothetical protein